MKTAQAGLTLIELVMLIVIVGILVAFAIPRYADLGGDARRASVQRIGYDLRSAAAYVHAKALAAAQGDAASSSVTLDDRRIAITYGYPDIASVKAVAQFSPTAKGYHESPDVSITPHRVFWHKVGSATGACSIVYSEASRNRPATVMTTVSGC